MLVHHAQTELSGLAGRPDGAIVAVGSHQSRVRQQHTVGDVHQGGFACSILTQQGVHLTGSQRKIGSAECFHGAETLSNSHQLEEREHCLRDR